MKKTNLIISCSIAITLFGCASTNKTEFSSAVNPEEAVQEVTALLQKADQSQSDLLSYDEYTQGIIYLKKAQKGLSGGYKKDYILDNAATAKGYLETALEHSEVRRTNATRILQSRKSSLDAGIKNSENLIAALNDVDDDLRGETDDFSEPLEPKEFSQFQKEYFSLEIKAVQFRELDSVKAAIQKAAKDDADDLAPNSLRIAMLDLNEAENFIAQSPRAPEVHDKSVKKAIESSVLLSDVMDVILNAKGTPENIALKIVHQNRELVKLSSNVGNLEKNLKTTETNLMEKEGALKTKDAELVSAKSNLAETESALILQNQQLEKNSIQIRFQKAMDEAVRQFSDDEASVYQQGSKLIFRLKKINFASGNAIIPPASKPLLVKVNDIIKSIGAELVAVQGHTDSVGKEELNVKLSTRRAVSVANYLASLAGGYKIGYTGYGESRPIASNETKEGRAINRRVDLVVTAKK